MKHVYHWTSSCACNISTSTAFLYSYRWLFLKYNSVHKLTSGDSDPMGQVHFCIPCVTVKCYLLQALLFCNRSENRSFQLPEVAELYCQFDFQSDSQINHF